MLSLGCANRGAAGLGIRAQRGQWDSQVPVPSLESIAAWVSRVAGKGGADLILGSKESPRVGGVVLKTSPPSRILRLKQDFSRSRLPVACEVFWFSIGQTGKGKAA